MSESIVIVSAARTPIARPFSYASSRPSIAMWSNICAAP